VVNDPVVAVVLGQGLRVRPGADRDDIGDVLQGHAQPRGQAPGPVARGVPLGTAIGGGLPVQEPVHREQFGGLREPGPAQSQRLRPGAASQLGVQQGLPVVGELVLSGLFDQVDQPRCAVSLPLSLFTSPTTAMATSRTRHILAAPRAPTSTTPRASQPA